MATTTNTGAEMLRAWLSLHGMSQAALSRRLCVSAVAISNIIKGRAGPGRALAERIAVATRYPDESARAAVDGVPASAWLTDTERAQLDLLLAAAAQVELRARQDTAAAVGRWLEWMMCERDRMISEIGSPATVGAMSQLLAHDRLIEAGRTLVGDLT
jgi:transcriptional regulator with XRE-family HTH domain